MKIISFSCPYLYCGFSFPPETGFFSAALGCHFCASDAHRASALATGAFSAPLVCPQATGFFSAPLGCPQATGFLSAPLGCPRATGAVSAFFGASDAL